jgi:hypothetical protein
VKVFSFSPINRRSIRKGIAVNTGLRPVFTAILLPMLFRFRVYISAFPPQKQKNRRSPTFTAIPLNISNAILRVAPPFKKIACFSATL